MINGIIPLHKDSRNCYEDVFVTICSWFKRRYEYMYKNSWAFHYETNEGSKTTSLGKNLEYNNSKQFAILSEYSGIGISYHQNEDLNKGLEDIKSKLNSNTVVALNNMDMFWLPWTSSYQSAHGGHTFIITGFGESASSLFCLDPYLQMENLELSIDEYSKSSSGNYILFSIVGEEKKDFNVNYIVNRAANKVLEYKKSGNSFDQMRNFADDIELNYNSKKEMEGYQDFFSVPIYSTIQAIARGRKQFAELLRFLAEMSPKKELLESYSTMFDSMGKKWDGIKILFGKEVILSNYTIVKNKVPNKIREIADYEEGIARELQKIDFN